MNSGEAFKTLFNFTCSGWKTATTTSHDLPQNFTYKFFTIDKDGVPLILLKTEGTDMGVVKYLPPGSENGTLKMIAEVSDSDGVFHRSNISVKVSWVCISMKLHSSVAFR